MVSRHRQVGAIASGASLLRCALLWRTLDAPMLTAVVVLTQMRCLAALPLRRRRRIRSGSTKRWSRRPRRTQGGVRERVRCRSPRPLTTADPAHRAFLATQPRCARLSLALNPPLFRFPYCVLCVPQRQGQQQQQTTSEMRPATQQQQQNAGSRQQRLPLASLRLEEWHRHQPACHPQVGTPLASRHRRMAASSHRRIAAWPHRCIAALLIP